jgi:cell division protease FtsH
MNDKNPNHNKMNNGKIKSLIIMVVVCLLLTVMFNGVLSRIQKGKEEKISYAQFLEMIDNGEIESVSVESDKITLVPKQQENPVMKTTYYCVRISDLDLVNRLQKAKEAGKLSDFESPEASNSSALLSFFGAYILPFILFFGVYYFIMRSAGRGGMMGSVGKSTAKLYMEKKTGVTFADVAGQDEAKESLTEMVDFLHNPNKYLKIGAKLPKGALLVGPPGTGKTLLAKAVAGEANVPFFSLSGSDFVEMFVGVGASRVRDLFKQAQAVAPCIIFIDEIDAIGKSREGRYGGGNDEREQTLNQLLAEMDGFDTSKGLVILAATNRPEVLDKALLRPGRFDRRVIVERPDLKGRIETLKVHAKDVLMDDSVDFEEIALATSGAVGSDLANMVNEAALSAVKAGRTAVSQKDLFEAVEVVIAGKEKKDRILNKEEKEIVSYHEVGHALAIALQKHTEPVQKITIVPRTMGALGYTMQVPEEEKYLMSKEEMLNELVTLFGGRAAEEVKFHSVTTGASNDIERATSIARSMITRYGMSDTFGLIGMETVENQYLDGRSVLNCSDQTAAKIDEEVMKILKNAYGIALDLLRNNMEALDEIAHFLIEKETITGKEFMEIFERIQNEKNAPAESAESPESIEEDTDAVESTESVEENAAPADSTESTEENAATAESTDENTQEV